jgi:peptidoglycan/LPS O-acetylase OafA/YrhL
MADEAAGAQAASTTTGGGPLRHGRRADIQGLRAVAVLLVVAYHADLPIRGGFVGVDVFFVISGYVIAAMLLRQGAARSGIGFATFYARRMRRLLPALAVAVVATSALSVLLLSPLGPQQATGRTGIAAATFSANVQLLRVGGAGYFDLASNTNALLHTWSLSVEEQFYLVFPAAFLVVWIVARRLGRGGSATRPAAALVLLATLASFALSCLTTYHPSDRLGSAFAFYMAPSRAWEFGVGVLLALAAGRLARIGRRLALAAGVAGMMLIGAGAFAISTETSFPGLAALLPVLGTALVIAGGSGPPSTSAQGVTALLSLRPAVWVGDVSYGWYLWHWPLIVFAAAWWPGDGRVLAVSALVSLAPTWISYRWVEAPIRANDRLVGWRVVPLVVACLVLPIAASGGLLVANRVLERSDQVTSFASATRLHTDVDRGCSVVRLDLDALPSACTWAVDDSIGTAFLLGDSTAGHFTEPVTEAGNRLGLDVVVATWPGCAFLSGVERVSTVSAFDGGECADRVEQVLDGLVEEPPALVVLSSSATERIQDPTEHLRDRKSGAVATTPKAKAELWEQGLATAVDRLTEAGIPTLVVQTAPQFTGAFGTDWSARACPAVKILRSACGQSRDRAAVEAERALAVGAQDRAVAGSPLAATLDLIDEICSPTRCSTERRGTPTYRDAIHLTVDGARRLTGSFERSMAQRLGERGR